MSVDMSDHNGPSGLKNMILFFSISGAFWLLFAFLMKLIFNELTSLKYNNNGMLLQTNGMDKLYIYLLCFLFNLISQSISAFIIRLLIWKFQPEWLEENLKEMIQ